MFSSSLRDAISVAKYSHTSFQSAVGTKYSLRILRLNLYEFIKFIEFIKFDKVSDSQPISEFLPPLHPSLPSIFSYLCIRKYYLSTSYQIGTRFDLYRTWSLGGPQKVPSWYRVLIQLITFDGADMLSGSLQSFELSMEYKFGWRGHVVRALERIMYKHGIHTALAKEYFVPDGT